MNKEDGENIKEIVEEFLRKMTLSFSLIDVMPLTQEQEPDKDVAQINITMEEPQILIGQNGQTLFELQRIVRIIINKKLNKDLYITLDINGYKQRKIEYLKDLAVTLADNVVATKEKKVLAPMPAYERRIIHAQLAKRHDITTQSQGEGEHRSVVILPK